MYALLPDKSKNTYIKTLEAVKNFEPTSLPAPMTDFENGFIKTCKKVYPNTIQRGYFFHFSPVY